MSGELSGKLAIVTGGGSGIGRAVAQLFAQEGATVDIVDINQEGISQTLAMLPKGEMFPIQNLYQIFHLIA